MTLKVEAFTIDDPDLEVGFAQAAQAHLDATGEVLTPEQVAASAFEAYRGSVKNALHAKIDEISLPADLAEIAVLVDSKVPVKVADVDPLPVAEPPVEIKV
jgi:hypothetical protein